MAIKTTVNPHDKKVKPFPKLMKHDDGSLIVLSISDISGIVIIGNSKYTPGHYSDSWNPSIFNDFNDPITLQNK